jgi:hypothetical protein
MPVAVPNLIGLGSGEVETRLESLKLRWVQKFPFDANGTVLPLHRARRWGQ